METVCSPNFAVYIFIKRNIMTAIQNSNANYQPQINPRVQAQISALYADAKYDALRAAKGIAKAVFRPVQPKDLKNVYLPVSQEQGEFFYDLILKHNFRSVVEFGTSFGISTLFLAAAVKETGGQVVTTELLANKAHVALQNLDQADLSEQVDLREGDALKTLANFDRPVDFLMLDGWKNLYLPLFRQLEPLFHEGTIIYADNVDMADARPLLDYVYSKPEIYQAQKLHQGKGELIKLK